MEITTINIVGLVFLITGNYLLFDWIANRIGIRTSLHRFWKGENS